ncbi:MAG: hypothetical protein ACLR56_07045 [Oscillospiraceae bacterium]
MAKTMAEEITAAERTAEQTLLEAEKKALLIVSDAKEKAKADRKSILENAENVADGLLRKRGKRLSNCGRMPVTRLKARLIP